MSNEAARLLILLRHAKAESPRPGQADSERPLSESGLADAETVGSWLAEQAYLPELVLCSPARRTKQTWALAATGMARTSGKTTSPTVAYVPALYSNGVDALIAMIAAIPDEVGQIMVVGHNPTVSVVSAVLDPKGGNGTGLKTASLAVHQVKGPWRSCVRGMAPLLISHTSRAARKQGQ